MEIRKHFKNAISIILYLYISIYIMYCIYTYIYNLILEYLILGIRLFNIRRIKTLVLFVYVSFTVINLQNDGFE